MHFSKQLMVAAVLGGALAGPVQAITVDGDVSDWLQTPSQWDPRFGLSANVVEDDSGGAGAYLNPGYGGQKYDAEALYLDITADFLYVAVVTGLRPEGHEWEAGDIAFDFGSDGVFEFGLVTAGGVMGIGAPGELYDVSDWAIGGWKAPKQWVGVGDSLADSVSDYQTAHPTAVTAGTRLGGAPEIEFAYTEQSGTLGALGGKHYVIEAAIPMDLFNLSGKNSALTVHWTMGCNNDWIEASAIRPTTLSRTSFSSVPEPSVLTLLAAGMFGLGRLRKR